MCTIKVSAVILLLCVISLEAQNLLMITTGDLSKPFYSSDLKNTKYNSTRILNLNKLLQGNYNQPNYEYSTILEDDSGSSVQSVGEEKLITREDNTEPKYVGYDSDLRNTVAEFYFINMTNRTSGQKKISDSSNINDYINSTFGGLQSNEIFQTDANKNFTQVINISYNNQEKPHDFQPQSSKLNENSKISVKIEKISNSPSQNSKNVTNSTESLFPITINFSINSKQDNSSYVRSLPSIEHEIENVTTTITLGTTTLQESNNNKGQDSNQKKEFIDMPISNNRQLFVPVTIELPSNSRSHLDKIHNISYSPIENKKELSNNGNILLLKSNYNYSAQLPQNNSDERSNGLTKAILKNVLNEKSKSKNNSLIFVKLSPVNIRPLNFDFVEKSTDYQSNANKPQENITLSNKIIVAIFPSNYNLSQNNNDHMGAIRNISTNDSITEIVASNANKQISSVTISLFPNYTLQSTGNSKIEIRSGIFHDNKDNNNKDILSSDQMRHSLLGEFKAKEKNPSNLTEPLISQVPSKSTTNNKIYHVFHSNDSQVTINNMVNGNSSLMEVIIESNLKEASKLQSKQNILNSSEIQFEFDSNRSPLPTETNTAVIQQSKLKNVPNTGQVNARIKGDVLVKLTLNNSDILKMAKIEGKPPGIISINLNHSQKSINPEVDTSNNYQKGYEGKSLVASTEKLTVPIGEMLDNFSSSISSLSTTLNQHSSPSVPNSILLQKVEEIINNDPITIYYPKKSLISKINDNREEDVIQDYIDSYGTSNLNIVLNHPKGIPEIVLNDHFFTSEEKLLITTSQGDKLIIRKENEENDAKNNLKKDNPLTQIQEIKNVSESANVEGFDEKGGIQSIAEDIYIHTGANKEKSVRILTRRYRNEDRGPLWWVSTDEGFAPEGGIPASTGFILKIENDEPGQGFTVDDILRK